MTCQATDVVMVFQNGEELPVCSQVLRLASPVFDAMLGSGLVESQGGRIEVSIAEKETFEEVYELIKPCAWDPSKITKENLSGILKISNYYQLETIKKRCAAVLAGLPASLPHFWLARDHCVHEAYKKFIVKFGLNCTIFLAVSLSKDKDAVERRVARCQGWTSAGQASKRQGAFETH